MLKHFNVDPSRHNLTVDVKFYQMNLTSVVESARRAEKDLFVDDGVFLPSWSKFVAHPTKAKGFFINTLQAVFEGKGGNDGLNVEFQTSSPPKVSMMFLPGSTKNDDFPNIVSIAQQALKGYKIVPVYGEKMTNASSEQLVKNEIEIAEKNSQNVLIVSAGMAQRSFSIPQITHLFLAYDSGDCGATIQKMSRALTPDKQGKVGHIISLSFNPNRDDKFDSIILETAQNYNRNHRISNLKKSLQAVIKTVDIFRCQEEGAVKIEIDEYLETIIESKSLDRVIGKIADLNSFSPAEIKAIAEGNFSNLVKARAVVAQNGKTRLAPTTRNLSTSTKSASQKDIEAARKVLATIAENIDVIYFYSNKSLEASFEEMDKDGIAVQEDVKAEFGVSYDLIKAITIGHNGTPPVLNRDLLDLKFNR